MTDDNKSDAMAATVSLSPARQAAISAEAVNVPDDQAGTRLGRFELRSLLGRGGMGAVYRGFDITLERDVAIKLLLTDDGEATQRLRLLREAKAMAKLSHPNLLTVYEAGAVDGQYFIAMELVEGTTLRGWTTQQSPSEAQILDAFISAGRGLQAAHDAGIVHRDFKPENVLVSESGAVQVADFGVATIPTASTDVALTRTGLSVGTPRYMSPEQHLCEPVDTRSDQFSFGVALAEALNGETPFPGDTYAEIASHVLRSTPVLKNRKTPLGIVLVRAMARAPEDRFASMNELIAALTAARTTQQQPGRAIKPWLIAAVAALAVAAVATVVAVKLGSSTESTATARPGSAAPAPTALADSDAGTARKSPVTTDEAAGQVAPRPPTTTRAAPAPPYAAPEQLPGGWRIQQRKGQAWTCTANHTTKSCATCCSGSGVKQVPYPNCSCYKRPASRPRSRRPRGTQRTPAVDSTKPTKPVPAKPPDSDEPPPLNLID